MLSKKTTAAASGLPYTPSLKLSDCLGINLKINS